MITIILSLPTSFVKICCSSVEVTCYSKSHLDKQTKKGQTTRSDTFFTLISIIIMEDYIRKNHLSFDPVVFLEYTCSSYSRESATSQFEKIVDRLAVEETQSSTLKKWCQMVKDSNYEVSLLI